MSEIKATFENYSFPEIKVQKQADKSWKAFLDAESWFMPENETPSEDIGDFEAVAGTGSHPRTAILSLVKQFKEATARGEVLVTKSIIHDYERPHHQTYKFDGKNLSRGKYIYIAGVRHNSPEYD